MTNSNSLQRVAILLGVICTLLFPAVLSAAPPAKVSWQKIEATVTNYFAAMPGYQSGDIISRNQVEPLLKNLATLGWKVRDQQRLLAKVPADGSWLVTNLRTPKGVQFMRQIAAYPGGYDCVDRMTAIGDGRNTVSALIQGPGGQQLIQYLTTSRTGKNMAKELTLVPGGANFDKPTGMLYTASDLLGELARLYAPPAPAPKR